DLASAPVATSPGNKEYLLEIVVTRRDGLRSVRWDGIDYAALLRTPLPLGEEDYQGEVGVLCGGSTVVVTTDRFLATECGTARMLAFACAGAGVNANVAGTTAGAGGAGILCVCGTLIERSGVPLITSVGTGTGGGTTVWLKIFAGIVTPPPGIPPGAVQAIIS